MDIHDELSRHLGRLDSVVIETSDAALYNRLNRRAEKTHGKPYHLLGRRWHIVQVHTICERERGMRFRIEFQELREVSPG